MKTGILILFLLTAGNSFAFENFLLKWNVGNLGLGLHIPLSEKGAGEFELGNFFLEHKNTGMGIKFNPAKFWANENLTSTSLLNLGFYWNMLNPENNSYMLALFSDINYIHMRDKNSIIWNDFISSSGLRFGFASGSGNFRYNVFNIEMGYRNISANHRYYISANVDVVMLFILILLAKSEKKSEKEN